MTTQSPVKQVQETRTGELMHPLDMFEEMEQWAERMFPLAWMRPLQRERLLGGGTIPQVDIIDRESELVVRAAVPGFRKDEIEITSTADAVTLRGRMQREEKEEKGDYYRRETRCEDFLRTVHLPCLVDDTKAKATFKDGMLELIIPKVEPAKRRTVKIEEA